MAKPLPSTGLMMRMPKSQLAVAFFVLGSLLLLIQPIPAFLLDSLIVVSLGSAVLTLMVVLFLRDPAEFSTFPTLLLITTLFRLGLNVASTRLILSTGEAGQIISAFGEQVVGGNYVIGVIIFALLTVINFVVITKGAGRIAEVAARFTLDALPGKQMAIDQELNSGAISEIVARQRRQMLQREIDFYGAMDGSSKFVRGDAIAAILIAVINVVGGFLIGVFQRNESAIEVLSRYTILSIGDGLVSQVPSLIFSTAAALLVTRAAARDDLGTALGQQLVLQRRPVLLTAAAMGIVALMPGFPTLLLLCASGLLFALWRTLPEKPLVDGSETAPGESVAKEASKAGQEPIHQLLSVDPLEIQLGFGLVTLADVSKGGDLLERVTGVRKNFAQTMGFVVPSVRLWDNLQLDSQEYQILFRGSMVGRGTLRPGRWLAMNISHSDQVIPGEATTEPVFNLPAVWIDEQHRSSAELAGYTVVDSTSVLVTHFQECIRRHAHQLLSRQDVDGLLDNLKKSQPALVNELVPNQLNLGQIQRILQNLLTEGISIRNLVSILERIADSATTTKNIDELSEQARRAIGPELVKGYLDDRGNLSAITLESWLEEELAKGLHAGMTENTLALTPMAAQHLSFHIGKAIQPAVAEGRIPVLLCSGVIRLGLRKFFGPTYPDLRFLAYEELPPRLRVNTEYSVPSLP
jgi:flagellar biosynthesis protein FlhA